MKVSLLLLPLLLLLLVLMVVPGSAARSRRLSVRLPRNMHVDRRVGKESNFRLRIPRNMRASRRVGKDNYSRERFLAIPQLPYPYYQRPRYRYPFYDRYGNGKLLYGYGDGHLYTYTQFKPLDGYSKRR